MPSGLRSSARAPRVISARAPRPRNSSWNLATGPSYTITNPTNGSLHSVACTSAVPCDKANLNTAYTGNSPAYPTGASNSFLADVISLDSNLDYRVDVMYAGTVMTNSASPPTFIGKMYRLTTRP